MNLSVDPNPTAPVAVDELVMIYDADGGIRGELAYGWGKLRRTAHCSLCDITHHLVKQRRSWSDWRCRVGVTVTVLHRNERSDEIETLSGDRTPCVLARTGDGLMFLLGPGELDACDGDLAVFEAVLATALDRAGMELPGTP